MIEPSVTYGDLYLTLTGELAAAYKSGVVPAGAQEPPVPPTPTETPAGEPGPETTLTADAADTPAPSTETLTDEPGDSWPTPRPDGTIVHIVELGDTLLGIANRYGVSLDDLLVLNDLERTTILNIGQNIVVAVLTPTPTSSPTLTPTPTGVPAIRAVPSLQSTRRPTAVTPTGAPSVTATGMPTTNAAASPSATPSPAAQGTGFQSDTVLPWPALTLGLLLVLAIWLLFRSPGSD